MDIANLDRATAFTTADGSTIRELFGPACVVAANQSLAEAMLPPGGATQRHYHRLAEEIYYITHGSARMEIDGEERTVAAGDAILIPAGAWHQITATSQEPLRLLCSCAPAYAHEDTYFV